MNTRRGTLASTRIVLAVAMVTIGACGGSSSPTATVATPTFSPGAGAINAGQKVTISTMTANFTQSDRKGQTLSGVLTIKRPGKIREWRYDDQDIVLKQGEEMGRFLLGSTVIMTFPKGDLAFNPAWAPARSVRLGEEMANYRD